ncbi:hypothetical protein GK047_07850 [Paenibacillus sp. SYP-B3998]|uniref:Uncharacterized protein n=1 Tax=Paenibacillus sp. SYP-B3998 TaxID=2678564 RepID=A0A6G3ZUN9_9BACL|nr:hypothetical protein [Paenibacillus sp. SYP-B3998]NEW05923.1 hypothetical protein [Paenibacillus sp. SYP-B3998]
MKRTTIGSTALGLLVGVVAGAGIMLNDTAYDSVKQAIGQGATNNAAVAGVGGTTAVNVSNMDLDAAMQVVQSQRAAMLETQLKDQMDSIKKRNEDIAGLNDTLAKVIALQSGNAPYTLAADLKTKLQQAGAKYAFKATLTADELKATIDEIKGKIDSLNNAQQMDMLRMQSLTNKRNEGFETMTNFIKKMQESRSSNIGNMR